MSQGLKLIGGGPIEYLDSKIRHWALVSAGRGGSSRAVVRVSAVLACSSKGCSFRWFLATLASPIPPGVVSLLALFLVFNRPLLPSVPEPRGVLVSAILGILEVGVLTAVLSGWPSPWRGPGCP